MIRTRRTVAPLPILLMLYHEKPDEKLDQKMTAMTFNLLRVFVAFLTLSVFSFASERDAQVLRALEQLDARIDPENGFPWGTHNAAKGYHSNFERGTRVHPTRGALDRAALLLASPKEEHHRLGAELLEKVLKLQDVDPESRTFGVWPWYAEEPLAKMAAVDFNWADFQGAVLAVILRDYPDRLPEPLRTKTRLALEYATRAIIKRNVGPGYTNIAVMGATVSAAAGEILDRPDFLEYGRKRIRRSLDHYRETGGFNEYNSPAYGMVVVRELERMIYLVADPYCKGDARALLEETWKSVGEHYHVPTGQWAGPHSRSYSDRLSEGTRRALLSRAGLLETPEPGGGASVLLPEISVPEQFRHFFSETPDKPVRLHNRFVRGKPHFETTGTTWMDDTLAVGSASYHSFWEQARGLIAYWKPARQGDRGPVFRLRFEHDSRDFSSGWGRHDQKDTKIVTAIGLVTNQGSMHPSFDRPAGGVFRARSFRIVYSLDAADAWAQSLDDRRFELGAGPVRAVVHVAPESVFDGQPVRWSVEKTEGGVRLIGTCYEGEEKAFEIEKMGLIRIGAALEFLQDGQTPSSAPVRLVESDHSTPDGPFFGVVWPEVNSEAAPLLAPLKPTRR